MILLQAVGPVENYDIWGSKMYVLAILTVTSLINNFKKVIALQLNLRADGKKHVTAGLSLLKNSTNPRTDQSII